MLSKPLLSIANYIADGLPLADWVGTDLALVFLTLTFCLIIEACCWFFFSPFFSIFLLLCVVAGCYGLPYIINNKDSISPIPSPGEYDHLYEMLPPESFV